MNWYIKYLKMVKNLLLNPFKKNMRIAKVPRSSWNQATFIYSKHISTPIDFEGSFSKQSQYLVYYKNDNQEFSINRGMSNIGFLKNLVYLMETNFGLFHWYFQEKQWKLYSNFKSALYNWKLIRCDKQVAFSYYDY